MSLSDYCKRNAKGSFAGKTEQKETWDFEDEGQKWAAENYPSESLTISWGKPVLRNNGSFCLLKFSIRSLSHSRLPSELRELRITGSVRADFCHQIWQSLAKELNAPILNCLLFLCMSEVQTMKVLPILSNIYIYLEYYNVSSRIHK